MAESICIVILVINMLLVVLCFMFAAWSVESAIKNFKKEKYFICGLEVIAFIFSTTCLLKLLLTIA